MATTRYGRCLKQPDRYQPDEMVSDDATDEEESVEMGSSFTSDSTGSLRDFVVDDDDDDDGSLEQLNARYREFIATLCQDSDEDMVEKLIKDIEKGGPYDERLKGAITRAYKDDP